MNVALDFGNTRIKIGVFQHHNLLSVDRFEELELAMAHIASVEPESIIISSVTKSKQELEKIFFDHHNVLIFTTDCPIPIINDYGSPKTLGLDRLAAAVGANARFPKQNCLIVDLGTAAKYDFIDNEGKFRGGIISLGRRMRFKALYTFTQKLPLLEEYYKPELIGTNTKDCMVSGVINGMLAEINGFISEYAQLGELQIIITGGDAGYFESHIKYPTFAAPNLVLEGLNRILIYNASKN